MRAVRVEHFNDFDAKMKELSATKPGPTFVVFFGTEDPAMNNKSWCSDCVVADPVIRKHVSTVPDAVLVECPAGSVTAWKGSSVQDHKYKRDFGITNLPTLVKWNWATNSQSKMRLVEGENLNFEAFQRLSKSMD